MRMLSVGFCLFQKCAEEGGGDDDDSGVELSKGKDQKRDSDNQQIPQRQELRRAHELESHS